MDDEDKPRPNMAEKEFQERVAAGQPILHFYIDEPFSVSVDPSGNIAIDFPWMGLGDATAVFARAVLPANAAGRLRSILSAVKAIPEVPAFKSPDSTN